MVKENEEIKNNIHECEIKYRQLKHRTDEMVEGIKKPLIRMEKCLVEYRESLKSYMSIRGDFEEINKRWDDINRKTKRSRSWFNRCSKELAEDNYEDVKELLYAEEELGRINHLFGLAYRRFKKAEEEMQTFI